MSRDYMPHAESQLTGWADQFVAFAEAHAAEIGLTEDELTALVNEHEAFDAACTQHDALTAQARGACRLKDSARRSLVERMRGIAMRIQTAPAITDAERRGLGLSLGLPKEHVPLDTSDEKPRAVINAGQRLRHVLHITNTTEKGSSKARPANATGCEVWMKIGDRPSDPSELSFVTTVTNGRHSIDFQGEFGGQKVYYMLRWVGRRSTVGNWSQTFSATVAA